MLLTDVQASRGRRPESGISSGRFRCLRSPPNVRSLRRTACSAGPQSTCSMASRKELRERRCCPALRRARARPFGRTVRQSAPTADDETHDCPHSVACARWSIGSAQFLPWSSRQRFHLRLSEPRRVATEVLDGRLLHAGAVPGPLERNDAQVRRILRARVVEDASRGTSRTPRPLGGCPRRRAQPSRPENRPTDRTQRGSQRCRRGRR